MVTIVTSVLWDMKQVLRQRCLYGKNNFFLFNWSLFIITQWNCSSIGLCSIKKLTNGSVARARAYGYAASLPHLRFIWRSDWGLQLIARPEMQYSFHISGNGGYDSTRVRSLSIFPSYCVEDVTCTVLKYNHVVQWRGTTQHQDSPGSKTQGSQENTPSTEWAKGASVAWVLSRKLISGVQIIWIDQVKEGLEQCWSSEPIRLLI